MRLSLLLSSSALLATAAASGTGALMFCLGVKKADGSCKFQADYALDFAALGPYSKAVRIYSTSDCNTMQEIMPAAKAAGFKVLLGIWATDADHFALEKTTVQKFLPLYRDQVSAITVGSEHLYRGDLTGTQLAAQITEVRNLVKGLGYTDIPIGTADSWNKYKDGTADPVIAVSDILLTNSFSFWEGQSKADMTTRFFNNIGQALAKIEAIKGTSDFTFYVGETGWPTSGSAYDQAVPDLATAELHWQSTICGLRHWGINLSVFEAFDEPWKPAAIGDNGVALPETSWGVFTSDRKLKYKSLSC
ncbi:hypothetical protein BCR37DRAFT_405367 [Protomyces lactucae-debilis]|uniref:glucan 1,3-beta-glucosidase n=1 Tax=Protomyces lactucae-debilis TaxID=2754530 RepID=A0A1Y2F3Q3_PROLT|nr:uncharacterized protein BCR37DRAFT_405367 [Protomyces lactucae-debilis]ORY78538.1 hypothetical protein BCR37DRAFT_405367 [Protomyces lactucae-debilis]